MVLNGIDFTIGKGETFVIIGQSGIGKTVALRHIAGLLEPDAGDVLIDNVKMNGAPIEIRKKLRERMGVLFQSGALLNWLTVKENIALPLTELKRFPPDEIERIVNEKIHLLQLDDAVNKLPGDISGGMKKRVALARVLVTNPDIILYDEPTSGLDPVMSSIISDLIRQMQAEFGVTSLVVTHDMNSAFHVGDRIGMLFGGDLVQVGTADEIKNTKNPFVRQFINGSLEGPIQAE
ncbi:MAG: ATP-binding cassette domain-containing protein [Spirochaetes bacterium]|nr:MAG: ATP-binding cassette domain-containing protein [Spirochaetota bacterium]